MNKNSIETIKTYIKPDEDLIAKTKEMSLNAEKKKHTNHIRYISIAACLILLFGVAVSTFFLFNSANIPTEKQKSDITTNPIEQTHEKLYSNLTDTSTPIDKDILGFKSNFATADIASFNEAMLNHNCIAIVEGQIVGMEQKEYTIISKYEKFGADTVTEKIHTVVYEMQIAKVWYGDIAESQTIIIEDMMFFLDEVLSLKTGHSYVIPLCNAGDEIWKPTGGEFISGNIKRESIYSTVYHFHPQIEAVNSGYIFSNDWKTLTTDEAISIEMDVELGEEAEYYKDKMLFLPKSDFHEQFEKIINNLN